MSLFCRDLGCHAFGESREQEAAAKSAECNSAEPVPPIRWHMVGQIQRNKARSIASWAYAAHSVDSAKLITALDRASAARWPRAAGPIRCGCTSRSASTATSRAAGSTSGAPTSVDELCALAQSAEALQFVGLMGIPPLGSDPDDAFARLQAEQQRVQRDYPQRLGLSAGMSSDLEIGGKTWFDMCACRYRANGTTTANVTMSSHSSHIFITDTSSSRRVQR